MRIPFGIAQEKVVKRIAGAHDGGEVIIMVAEIGPNPGMKVLLLVAVESPLRRKDLLAGALQIQERHVRKFDAHGVAQTGERMGVLYEVTAESYSDACPAARLRQL